MPLSPAPQPASRRNNRTRGTPVPGGRAGPAGSGARARGDDERRLRAACRHGAFERANSTIRSSRQPLSMVRSIKKPPRCGGRRLQLTLKRQKRHQGCFRKFIGARVAPSRSARRDTSGMMVFEKIVVMRASFRLPRMGLEQEYHARARESNRARLRVRCAERTEWRSRCVGRVWRRCSVDARRISASGRRWERVVSRRRIAGRNRCGRRRRVVTVQQE
jgi:hypothetical protein